jgi:hypothetical protein
MPKMTKKFSRALLVARVAKVVISVDDQEALYKRLNEAGLWWDSKAEEWINFAAMPANEPTPKLMIRVWAAAERAQADADEVIKGLRGKYRLIGRNGPYPCRPPQQKEHRIYLEFLPDDGTVSTKDEIIRDNDPYAVEIE